MTRARDIADLGASASSGFNPSNVLEVVSLNCDGGSVTVPTGTYTSTNVTTHQSLTTSYATLTGSELAYTAPAGATAVIYEFNFSHRHVDAHPVFHVRFEIDGSEVVYARTNVSANSAHNSRIHFKWVIPIGGTASANTGRVASWSSAKTLRLRVREYGSGNEANLHQMGHWNGSGTATFAAPTLMITAVKDTA